MAALTDLHLTIRLSRTCPTEVDLIQCFIARCAHLRRLSLRGLRAKHLSLLLATPLLQLQTLVLDELTSAVPQADERAQVTIDFTALGSFPGLREIRVLRGVRGSWMVQPTQPPGASSLDSTPRRLIFSPACASELPSVDNLRSALLAMPGLTVEIELYRVHRSVTPGRTFEGRLRDLVWWVSTAPDCYFSIKQLDLLAEQAELL